ncbi:MAG: metal-dependent hydrolase, partial [Halobacteriaceae archaeon]
VVVGLAMVPDYDQRIPGLSHRGITHTVYFAGIVGTILGLLGLGLGASVSVPAALGGSVFGFLVGMATIGSHILADMLTPAGVDPLHHGNRRSYELVRSDSTLANYGLFALGVLAIGGAVLIGRTLAPIMWVGTRKPHQKRARQRERAG